MDILNKDLHLLAVPKTSLWELTLKKHKYEENPNEENLRCHYGFIGDIYERQTKYGNQKIIRNVPIFLYYVDDIINQEYYEILYIGLKTDAKYLFECTNKVSMDETRRLKNSLVSNHEMNLNILNEINVQGN